jgi:hypothetical protein
MRINKIDGMIKMKDSMCDKQMYDRLMSKVIFVSGNFSTVKNSQTPILIGQSMFECFINEFSIVREELFPHCMIKDFQATKDDLRQWMGSDYQNSSQCKEVVQKMEVDIRSKVKKYIELLETIKEQTGDDAVAAAVFHEVMKDIRSENSSSPKKVYNSDSPATDKQIEYLKKLGVQIPEHVTRQQASDLIDHAQQWKNDVKQALKNPIKIPC